MDCQGTPRTIGNQDEEEETRLSALRTRNCSAIEDEEERFATALKDLGDHPSLRPEARETNKGRVKKWYVFVRQLGSEYFVGRTNRHPSLDVILPSVLVECVACAGYAQSGRMVKSTYATYKKRHGGKVKYHRGLLPLSRKDLYTAPALPEYSYDPAMVRQV